MENAYSLLLFFLRKDIDEFLNATEAIVEILVRK